MWIAMQIGLRNLRRRLSRTLLTVGMLTVGTLLIVFSIGLNEGPYAQMIRMSTGTWMGQVQVLAEGYKDKPSLYKNIQGYEAIMADLERQPGVEAVTARVEVAGLLSAGNRTAATMLTGVIPGREEHVSTLSKTVKEGAFLKPMTKEERARAAARAKALREVSATKVVKGAGAETAKKVAKIEDAADVDDVLGDLDMNLDTDVALEASPTAVVKVPSAAPKPIVLGRGLAQRLRVKVGDEIVFMGGGADGSSVSSLFVLTGVMVSGADDLDAALGMIRLADAQQLMALDGRVHRIVGRTTTPELADGLEGKVKTPKGAVFYPWKKLAPQLWASIESDRQGGTVFVFIIVLMVLLGVINTTIMSVFERTRELGVMKALGASPGHIIAVVLWESFWIALFGVTAGALIGAGINEYYAVVGMEFFDEPIEFGGMKLQKFYAMNTFRGTVQYPLMIFGSAVAGAVWPAWRAAKLDPTQAIRNLT